MPSAAHLRAYPVRIVAERLGIPVATLRSWNRRYGIGPQEHTPGSHRLYSESDIAVAQRMLELVRTGVSTGAAARAAQATAPIPGPGEAIADLRAAVFRLDATAVAELLDAQLRHHGVEATWERLCRPVFADLVARQDSGEGCVDVEHLLSWTLVGSLHRAVPPPAATDSRPLLLACTPREHHSLPLEVLRAALAERDRTAHPLGPDLPVSALTDALRRPEHVPALVLWSQSPDTANVSALQAAVTAGAVVFAAGPGWPAALPDPVLRLTDLAGAVAALT